MTQFPGRLAKRIWGVFAAGLFFAVTVPTLLLLSVLPTLAWRRKLVRGAGRLTLACCGVLPRVEGLENLPPGDCIVVSNHASYLDGIILTAALPPQFSFVIKREMTQVPVVHFLLRRVGSEFLDRHRGRQGASDARRILKQAGTGSSLVFFPEGTFYLDPGLRHFHSGAFNAARRGEVPLVPVVIQGSRDMMAANRRLPSPGPLVVSIQPPILNTKDARTPELIARSRQKMLTTLTEPDLDPEALAAWREPDSPA
ncbi:MAG: lysophospholipid acyltransferase family protein [Gammaproteobacteria bacterium]